MLSENQKRLMANYRKTEKYKEYRRKYERARYQLNKEPYIRRALKSYYSDNVLLSLKRLFYNTCHLI